MARQKSLRIRVWEKSGGVCFLCGLQMIPDDTYGRELAYTIEHIIPRSRGGINEIENLDGSHQWCNQFKGESLMEELPSDYRKILRWKIKNFLTHMKPRRKPNPKKVAQVKDSSSGRRRNYIKP